MAVLHRFYCNPHIYIKMQKRLFSCSFINFTTCDLQQCGILTSVDSDKPVQPPFKLRNSKWCSVDSLAVIEKALIRLCICTHTTLFEISCHCSYDLGTLYDNNLEQMVLG